MSGTAERFEALVAIGIHAQRAELMAFDAERYVTSGGDLQHLVSGVRPADRARSCCWSDADLDADLGAA